MRSRSSSYPSLFALPPRPRPDVEACPGQEEFHWRGALAAGQRVEVKGVNGIIRAEATDGPEAEVTAIRTTGRTGRAEDVRIEQVPHAGGMTIRAVYPSLPDAPEERGEHPLVDRDDDVRVDFVVRVPRGVDFVGTTVNGSVRAESLPADATVSTVNGGVAVSAAGAVNASTVNGSIEAVTGRADPERDVSISTVNGNVVLHVPSGFQACVRASLMHGDIGGDFPLPVRRGQSMGTSAAGDIGGGGRTVNLSTVNGDIRIRRAGTR
jgi:hypothetical protein